MPVEKHYSGLDGVACSAQKGGDMYTALKVKEIRITGEARPAVEYRQGP